MPLGGGPERLLARDPLRAVRRSARVTLVACTGFYVVLDGLGNDVAAVYALFGAIGSGGMSFVPGTPRERARTLLAALPVAAAWTNSVSSVQPGPAACLCSYSASSTASALSQLLVPFPACAHVRTRLPTVADAYAGSARCEGEKASPAGDIGCHRRVGRDATVRRLGTAGVCCSDPGTATTNQGPNRCRKGSAGDPAEPLQTARGPARAAPPAGPGELAAGTGGLLGLLVMVCPAESAHQPAVRETVPCCRPGAAPAACSTAPDRRRLGSRVGRPAAQQHPIPSGPCKCCVTPPLQPPPRRPPPGRRTRAAPPR